MSDVVRHTLTLSGHSGLVYCCAVFAKDTKVVSCSYDHTLKIWDLGTGSCEHTVLGHGESVRHCAVFAGDSKFVSCSQDNTLRIWDLPSSYSDKWYSMRELQRTSLKSCPKGLLNACEVDEVEANDIIACACLELKDVQARWNVLKKEPFLTSWLNAELNPIDVFELMTITSTDVLDKLDSVARHLLFGRKEVQRFIQNSVEVAAKWPASWKGPWKSLAGMGLASNEKIPTSLVLSEEQVVCTDNGAPNVSPEPLWVPVPFKFTPLIGQELPDDDGSKVKFKDEVASTASNDGKLESVSSLCYKFDIDVWTRGNFLDVMLVDAGTQANIITVTLSGGGSQGPLHASCLGEDGVRSISYKR